MNEELLKKFTERLKQNPALKQAAKELLLRVRTARENPPEVVEGDDPLFIRTTDVARVLGIDRKTFQAQARSFNIPIYKMGNVLYVKRQDFESFLDTIEQNAMAAFGEDITGDK